MSQPNKTLDEQLELFTTPLVKEEPKVEVVEPQTLTKKDNEPFMAIWDYEINKFVDVPLSDWVEFQMLNTNLPHDKLNYEFLKRFK